MSRMPLSNTDMFSLDIQESFSEAKVNRLLECLEMGKEVVFD